MSQDNVRLKFFDLQQLRCQLNADTEIFPMYVHIVFGKIQAPEMKFLKNTRTDWTVYLPLAKVIVHT
jgi:hypothetical protein